MSSQNQTSQLSLKFLFLFFLFITLPSCSTSGFTPCQNFWVATDGSTNATGTSDDPFLTLQQARDAIRGHPAQGNCTIHVNIKGGVYRLSNTFVLAAQDSGAEGREIVYLAATGETPIISGAQQVTGWTLHDAGLTDAIGRVGERGEGPH